MKTNLLSVFSRIFFLVFCVTSLTGFAQSAQNITVTGTVSDKGGETLPGVNIVIKGTTTGTVTDMDGNYTIGVPSEATVLEYSFIGYKMKSVTVGSQRLINVVLESDIKSLSEFVV